MIYVDITRAILNALAEVHPRGIHADALACLVKCEELALRKELRLLGATGAVHCTPDSTEVRITESAIAMLRRTMSKH
ncbi:hypothetical protein [Piscinibacter sp.]|uniref:hypothetical protein n=1 Tax=Piscinibacter sp. TaxID=1903157 RepID=UPI002BA6AE09|nr:hypothetical protein [Albitalea sp.]HUG25925.1 hypothetical protein [Albitalea sp.]